MNSAIRQWPGSFFYGNQLVDSLQPEPHSNLKQGVFFKDIDGHQELIGTSRKNHAEAKFIIDHIAAHENIFEYEGLTIGIICAYKAQRLYIEEQCHKKVPFICSRIMFHTVDGFQGGERDVVYVSFVRSGNESGGIGFLDDPNRLNVAATRAKKLCLFVGNLTVLAGGSSAFRSLQTDMYDRGLII